MSTGHVSMTRFEGGGWVVNPTSLTDPYPYGGTPMGLTTLNKIRPGLEVNRIEAEEFGGATTKVAIKRDAAICAANSRGWNSGAIALIPGGTSTGYWSRNVTTSGARAGNWLTPVKLLHVPDSTDATALFTICYYAAVLPEATGEAAKSYDKELGLPLIFECTPDSTGRVIAQGTKSQISL